MQSIFDKKSESSSKYNIPKFFSKRNSKKHNLNGSVAILKQDEEVNSESVIVIGQDDLNLLYYLHQNEYKSVKEMIEKLKDILKDEEDEASPTIVILDSDQKVQYTSD